MTQCSIPINVTEVESSTCTKGASASNIAKCQVHTAAACGVGLQMVQIYTVIQILCAATDGCCLQPWLAGQMPNGASILPLLPNTRSIFFSSVSEELVTRIDVHLQSGDISVY